ncbi:GSCOCG00012589001-RA-CDS, partial [Cotesia congregata]
ISKVVAPLFIADAPARAEIQNIQYFSGKYGCNICEIKQKRCQPVVGSKTIRIYKFTDKRIKLRDELRMYGQAEQLIENPGKLIK